VANSVYVDLSPDGGKTWLWFISDPNEAIDPSDPRYVGDTFTYSVVLRDTMQDEEYRDRPTHSDQCLIRIMEVYQSTDELFADVSDGVFEIHPTGSP
jgi:hypothetical protein